MGDVTSQAGAARRNASGWAAFGVFLTTVIAFSGSLTHPLLKWDDQHFLVYNTAYQGLGWRQLRWMFTTFLHGPYQPLSWLSYAIDYQLWGLSAFGFHLTNVLLHAAGAAALYLLARRVLALAVPSAAGTSDLAWAAAASALLFAIHPLRVESVAWATERRDVLSGVFYIASVIWYVRYADGGSAARGRAYLLALLLFLLALLSKATGMAVPLVLLILDAYPLRRWGEPGRRLRAGVWLVLEKLPFVALAIAAGALALHGQAAQSQKMPDLATLGVVERLAIASHAVCFYVWKELVPIGLSPLYELRTGVDATLPPLWPWLTCAGGITLATFLLRRRRPALLSAWLTYLLLLAPVSGLVQTGMQLAADRYSYLPCIPFALLAGGALLRFRGKPASRGVRVAFAGALAVLFLLTTRQVRYWRDTEVLWARAAEVDPNCSQAHLNLAAFAFGSGNGTAGRIHVEHFERLRGDDAAELRKLGVALEQVGARDEALRIHARAAAIEPMSPDAVAEYGAILWRVGRTGEAADQFERVLARSPEHIQALINFGAIRARSGDPESAAAYFDRATAVAGFPADGYLAIAEGWRLAGRPLRAVEVLRSGVERCPDDPANVMRLAWMLATHPDADVRDGRKSLELANRLVELAGRGNARAQCVLAAALAENGRMDEARAAFVRAAELARTGGTLPGDAVVIEQALRDGRPVRDANLTRRD